MFMFVENCRKPQNGRRVEMRMSTGEFVSKYCQLHQNSRLRPLDMRDETSLLFRRVREAVYCPLIECDYVSFVLHYDVMDDRDRLLLLIAFRQKAFLQKFRMQFIGDGK